MSDHARHINRSPRSTRIIVGILEILYPILCRIYLIELPFILAFLINEDVIVCVS